MANVTATATGAVPIWMQASGADPVINYSGANLRDIIQAMYPNPGVVDASHLVIGAGTDNGGTSWQFYVSGGLAVMPGPGGQGAYLVRVAGQLVSISGSISPPVSGTRTHAIVLRYVDTNAGVGTGYRAEYRVIEDTDGTGISDAELVSDSPYGIRLANLALTSASTSITAASIDNSVRSVAGRSPGWTSVPSTSFVAGYVTGSPTLQYRRVGTTVELRGRINKSSGFFASGMTNVVNLGSGLAPTRQPDFAVAGSSLAPHTARLQVNTSGQIGVAASAASTLTVVHLDGIRYDLT